MQAKVHLSQASAAHSQIFQLKLSPRVMGFDAPHESHFATNSEKINHQNCNQVIKIVRLPWTLKNVIVDLGFLS